MKDRVLSAGRLFLFGLSAAAVLAPVLTMLIRYGRWDFLFYLAVWVWLPGAAVFSLFRGIEPDAPMKWVISFLLGTALLFAEYFLLYRLRAMALLRYLNPALSAAWLAARTVRAARGGLRAKLRERLRGPHLGGALPLCMLTAVCVTLCAFTLNYSLRSPELIRYADFTWQIGNVNQLASAHPFDDMRVTGVPFRYHFFSTLFFAAAKLIFGGPGWVYLVQCTVCFIPLLMALSLYSLGRRLFSSPWAAAFFGFCCTTGFSFSHAYHPFLFHWTSNVNAVGFASVCLTALFLVSLPLFGKDGAAPGRWCLTGILLALLAGLKGPYAAVYLFAAWVMFLLQAVRGRRRSLKDFAGWGALTALFAAEYKVLLSAGAAGYFSDFRAGSILDSAIRSPLGERVYALLGSSFPARLAALPFSLLGTLTVCAVPAVLCALDGISFLFGKRELAPDILLASLLAAAGLGGYYVFSISGSSQLYFLFAAVPFIGYISANKLREFLHRFPAGAFGAAALAVCLGMTLWGLHGGVIPELTDTSPQAAAGFYTGAPAECSAEERAVLEALAFLKETSDPDSLVATNRQGPRDEARSHLISAFAERRCFLEGYLYAAKNLGFDDEDTRLAQTALMFGADASDAEKHALAGQLGIRYFVIFAGEEHDTVPQDPALFEVCFKNPCVTICRVL